MTDEAVAKAFVLGGNTGTLALTSSFVEERGMIQIALVPIALTPLGITLGENWQRVGIATSMLLEWIERTFSADDERSFVTQIRDIDLLTRIEWQAPMPEKLDEKSVLNAEDLPEELFEALTLPAAPVVQCGTCRRLCVRDDFVWKDKQLCAWDYHAIVFGKRGPWRNGAYEERLFQTLPHCAYVAPPLLEELAVDVIVTTHELPDELSQGLINTILSSDESRAHLAVRSNVGFVLLREREH